MSTRTSGPMSFMAGLMAPRKYELIRMDYTSETVTNFGYFSLATDSTEIFLSRTEVTVDGEGREIRVQLFNTNDGIF